MLKIKSGVFTTRKSDSVLLTYFGLLSGPFIASQVFVVFVKTFVLVVIISILIYVNVIDVQL